MASQQLLFDFPGASDFRAETTLPLPEQKLARQALYELTQGGLIIEGAVGSGKSHLLNVWAGERDYPVLSPEDLPTLPLPLYAAIDGGTLTHATQENTEAAEKLFHIFNHVRTEGGLFVLTTSVPVAQLKLLPDLRTRLMTLPVARIDDFSEASLMQLLLKWAADCQLKLDKAVITYILKRAERSPVTLRALIARLNTLSLAEKRSVTVPLARLALEG